MAIGGRLLAQSLYVLGVLLLVPIGVRETSVYRVSLPAADRFAGTATRPGALCVLLAGVALDRPPRAWARRGEKGA